MTSLQQLEACLSRISDPKGEGPRTYIRLFEQQARATATAWDQMRENGVPLPALAGVPISVKDLFDVAGSTTTAGSLALKDAAPAEHDATVVVRLRAAGAVIVGTTNMTEFAMGGLGINPHYGTPRNPFDRATGRIPGGSSSGAAISVCDGMAAAAIGSDTAGSVRMPAALCGLVGFKPTARRVPLTGSFPLAATLDSIGPLAPTVATCALLDSILSGEEDSSEVQLPLAGLRFAVPQTAVLDDMEQAVAIAFSAALTKLSAQGARITEIRFSELNEILQLNSQGGFSVAEGYALHRKLLKQKGDLYDSIISRRFIGGSAITAADYIALRSARTELVERSRSTTLGFDAVLMPTVPITATAIIDLEQDEALYLATNRLLIRNPGFVNFLDRCALTLPCHEPGSAPVGLTLMGETMLDHNLLSIGRSVEATLLNGK